MMVCGITSLSRMDGSRKYERGQKMRQAVRKRVATRGQQIIVIQEGERRPHYTRKQASTHTLAHLHVRTHTHAFHPPFTHFQAIAFRLPQILCPKHTHTHTFASPVPPGRHARRLGAVRSAGVADLTCRCSFHTFPGWSHFPPELNQAFPSSGKRLGRLLLTIAGSPAPGFLCCRTAKPPMTQRGPRLDRRSLPFRLNMFLDDLITLRVSE